MKLKSNSKNFGIPYMGSKSKIMDIISTFFPDADHFYDLFGGGFAVTHYMMENRFHSYKEFHFNEIQEGNVKLIKDAINGKYGEDFKPEWVSRVKFMQEKDKDFYIKYIWSFGNNCKNYLYNKELEKQKKSMHNAVVFDKFDDFMKDTFGLSKWPNSMSVTGKRLFLKRLVSDARIINLERLESLQQLQNLERLERLSFSKLFFTSQDYRSVKIKNNSVIYCDPPYKGTADYGNSFSHDNFFEWVVKQKEPVFISEYNIEYEGIYLLRQIKSRSTLSKDSNSTVATEKLYGNQAAYNILKPYLK